MDGFEDPPGSWCWPPPTGRTPWTPRCAVPAGSTARSSSRCPTGPARRHRLARPRQDLGPDADLDKVAAATSGFSGADLANLVNEAAVTAVRGGRTTLTAADFDSARDRVLLGTRRSSPLAPGELATAPSTRPASPGRHVVLAALTRSAGSPCWAPGRLSG